MDRAPTPFPLRPGTNDALIYSAVVERNEYRLPRRLPPRSVVVDIGAHTGMFSHFALAREAQMVYAFEPEPGNFETCAQNLSQFGGRVELSRRAVWRSDRADAGLHFCPSSDTANTGGGTIIWDTDGPLVETISFDSVVESVLQRGPRRIDLVKIDCEGAEFPILLTSSHLQYVDRIVGEYHELLATPPEHAQVDGSGHFSLARLRAALMVAGFHVESERQATGPFGDTGLFFAERRGLRSFLRRFLQ